MTTPAKDSYLLVGKLVGTFGIKGELKLYSDWNVDVSAFKEKMLHLYLPEGHRIEHFLERTRRHKNVYLVTFRDIRSIDKASKLVGSEVYVCEEDLPRNNGEVYFSDIDSFRVLARSGERLGEITGFLESKVYDYIIVEGSGGETYEIPYIPELVEEIDFDTRTVILSEGWSVVDED